MTSVNTNAAALTALRTLQQTNAAMESTQNRISTGYKIGEAKDNAAYWSISTTLKSDNKSLSTVKDALGLGAATVDVAYEALNSTKDVLDEIQKKLTSATQDGLNKDTIQKEITELQKQLKSIADSAIFSGENWLSVDSSNVSFNALKQVVGSFARDASGAIEIGTIGIDISNVALFDAGNKLGIVNGAIALKDANGRDLNIGGVAQDGNTAAGGIEKGNAAGTDGVKGKAVFAGGFVAAEIDANDRAVLTYRVDGSGSNQTVTLRAADVKGSGFAVQGTVSSVDELVKAMNNAITREGKSDVVAINDGGKLALQRVDAGSNKSVEVVSFAGQTDVFTRNAALAHGADTGGALNVYEKQTLTFAAATANGTLTITPNGGGAVSVSTILNGDTNDQVADKVVAAFASNADVTAVKTSAGVVEFTYKTFGNKAANIAFAAGATGVTATDNETLAGSTETKAASTATYSGAATVFGDSNDTLLFKFTDSRVASGATQTVEVKLEDLVAAGITDSRIDSDQDMADALAKAFIRSGRTDYAVTRSAANTIKIEATTAYASHDIATVATTTTDKLDVDVATANTFGFESATTTGIKRGTDAVAAKLTSTSMLPTGGVTLDGDDKLYFDVKVGGAATATSVTIDKELVNKTLTAATPAKVTLGAFDAYGLTAGDDIDVTIEFDGVASTYKINGLSATSTAEEFAAKLNAANSTVGSVPLTDKGSFSVENGRLVLSSKDAGASNSVKVTNVVRENSFAGAGGLQVSDVAIGTEAKTDAGGKISNNREMALVVQAALDKAGVKGVTVGLDGTNLSFSTSGTGAASKIEIGSVQASSGANKISVDKIDISAAGLTAVNAKTADEMKAVIKAYISVVAAASDKVTAAAANLGSAASRIEMQQSFVNTLMDTIDVGVGNLIDADMSEESTKLQALQVKQQLGVQALSLANQSAQQLLRLFQ